MIYLASPYSHPDPAVVESRYRQTLAYVAAKLCDGYIIYSPIVHCHELAKSHKLPTDFAFWQSYNEGMLFCASTLWVLQLPGWDQSKGVQGELQFAYKNRIPVVMKAVDIQCV